MQNTLAKPLGAVLQEADLVSAAQVEVALRDQAQYQDLRIGEILALRGWIEQKTADFFAERWSTLIRQPRVQPIGYYLKEAGLLNEQQINTILSEQKTGQTWIRFGALVVFKGWLKQSTIDFFLKYLFAKQKSESSFTNRRLNEPAARSPHPEAQTPELFKPEEDIPWVD